jgi:beta-lactamase regulating signal transducer with metallopeptidase domain
LILFFKLVFDLFLLDPSNWAYFNGSGPYLVEKGERTLQLMLYFDYLPKLSVQLFTKMGHYFSITDLILEKISLSLAQLLLFMFLLGTAASFFRLILKIRKQKRWERSILDKSTYLFDFEKIGVFKSKAIKSPLVLGFFKQKILVPYFFKRLSLCEQKAVLYHELKHVKNFDLLIMYILLCIKHLFWPIPGMRAIQKELIFHRERICDQYVLKMNMKKQHLINALLKTVKNTLILESVGFYSEQLNMRLNALGVAKRTTIFDRCAFVLGALFLVAILGGKFWIF